MQDFRLCAGDDESSSSTSCAGRKDPGLFPCYIVAAIDEPKYLCLEDHKAIRYMNTLPVEYNNV